MLDISEGWISRKLRELQKRWILRRYIRAPFSRIGIQMYHVLISRKDSKRDPFDFVKECPFLYAYRKATSGIWNAFATLCIPANKESIRFLENGLKTIVELGFEIDLHKVHSAGVSNCFDYYQPKKGEWDIPWELLTIHLQRIQSDGLASSIPRIDTPENRVEIEIDDLDMQILDSIWNKVVSVSKIRSRLRVGQHRVAEKLQRLRENGLLVKTWDVHNIGLNEHAIIYCKNAKIGKTIAAWSLRLPRSRIYFSSREELVLVADLPRGGSFGLATALDVLNTDASIGTLSTRVEGRFEYPTKLWDSRYQRWKCPRERLETWVNQLE
jgi:hypothetical protein